MTKVLMISTDVKIFEEGSLVRGRMEEYGGLFDELHIIVFSTGKKERTIISKNVFAYPTNSFSKLFYISDAVKIGSDIKCSVITCQDPFETGLVGKKISEKTKVPLHIQIHTDFNSAYFRNSLLNKARVILSKRTLSVARAVRSVSERIKASLPPDIQAKTSVLPIFADLKSISCAPIEIDLRKMYPQFRKIILMASRLTPEKDIQTGTSAFSDILKEHPDTGLVIVGSGSEENKIRKSPKIIHLPWVPYETLVSYMKTSDIFLSASKYEGYGLSMLEAHAAGAALVATDAGIAPLLIRETAVPGDRKKIAELLSMALSGRVLNKPYVYPYPSKKAYLEAYKADIERTLI